MVGSYKINIIFGLIGFILFFTTSLSTRNIIENLLQSLFAFIIFYIFTYIFWWLFSLAIKDENVDNDSIIYKKFHQDEEENEIKQPSNDILQEEKIETVTTYVKELLKD